MFRFWLFSFVPDNEFGDVQIVFRLTLKGQLDVSPLAILLRSADLAPDEPEDNLDIPEFIVRYERKKPKTEHGLSTNEIVELGNLCESSERSVIVLKTVVKIGRIVSKS